MTATNVRLRNSLFAWFFFSTISFSQGNYSDSIHFDVQATLGKIHASTHMVVTHRDRSFIILVEGTLSISHARSLTQATGLDLIFLVGVISGLMQIGNQQFRSEGLHSFVLKVENGVPEILFYLEGTGVSRSLGIKFNSERVLFGFNCQGQTKIHDDLLFQNGEQGSLLFSLHSETGELTRCRIEKAEQAILRQANLAYGGVVQKKASYELLGLNDRSQFLEKMIPTQGFITLGDVQVGFIIEEEPLPIPSPPEGLCPNEGTDQ